jgi:hypothetical protein
MTNRERTNEIELQDVPLPQRRRTRGLLSQISAVLLQPVYFFRTLPHLSETRQWLWAGLLILFLIGFSAVRYNTVSQSAVTDTGSQPPIDFGGSGFEGDGGGFEGGGDLGGGIDLGGIPSDPNLGGGGAETPAGGDTNVSETLTIGFIAASEIVVSWLVISVLLIVVSLLRGRGPRLGHNFQIAVWATLPLALMALLQVLYFAAGGTPGQAGLSGLLLNWEFYQQQTPMVQDLMYSLAIRLTIFWLWSLALLYFGARNALHGPRLGALFIVVFWAVIIVVVPVLSGAVAAPDAEEEIPTEGVEGFPPGSEIFGPGSEFPSGEFPSGEFPEGEVPGGEFPSIVVTDEAGNITDPGTGDIILTEEGFPSDTGSETGNIEGEAPADNSTGSESEPSTIDEAQSEAPVEGGNVNVRPVEPEVERSVEDKPTP